MMQQLNPATVRPYRGMILVEIMEQQGGKTKHGLVILPRSEANQHLKDTAIGRVMLVGDPPWGNPWNAPQYAGAPPQGGKKGKVGEEWPREFLGLEKGQLTCFPRDVPLVWAWDGKRYGLVMQHELFFSFKDEDYDRQEIVPSREA